MFPALCAALDCVPSQTQKQSLASAMVVFQGTVVEIKTIEEDHVDLVIFETSRVWKGPPHKSVEVVAFRYRSQGDGYTFHAGAEYIVYATAEYPRELRKNWPELQRLAPEATVYSLPNCVPRVRSDINEELKLLGARWRKP